MNSRFLPLFPIFSLHTLTTNLNCSVILLSFYPNETYAILFLLFIPQESESSEASQAHIRSSPHDSGLSSVQISHISGFRWRETSSSSSTRTSHTADSGVSGFSNDSSNSSIQKLPAAVSRSSLYDEGRGSSTYTGESQAREKVRNMHARIATSCYSYVIFMVFPAAAYIYIIKYGST